MYYNVNITQQDITYGPVDEPNDVLAFLLSGELAKKGYRKVSNKYCTVARIDREDWVDVLSHLLLIRDKKKLREMKDDNFWKDHYVRCCSKDKLIIHPKIYKKIPRYW